MAPTSALRDRYSDHVGVRALEVGPERVVVEQAGVPELDNHVGIRHASALYALGWSASRTLVLTALGELAETVDVRLEDSEIRYEQVPLGLLTCTAEPAGDGWDSVAARLAAGQPAELRASATSINEQGKTVASLDTSWRLVRP